MKEVHRCYHCDKLLDNSRIVWLELSLTDGNYYKGDLPEGHESQGCFPFGGCCAAKVGK